MATQTGGADSSHVAVPAGRALGEGPALGERPALSERPVLGERPAPAGGTAPPGSRASAGRVRSGSVSGWLANPSLAAAAVWLVGAPVAFVLPRTVNLNPNSPPAWSFTVGLGLLAAAAAAGAAIGVRRAAAPLAGAAAGGLAVWVLFALRMALNGTPFGFSGLQGDAGRLAAGATAFVEDWHSSGSWIPDMPQEYPPLYLMAVGRIAAALGEPGWKVLADAEVVGVSLAVLACFMMWRRLVPAWASFAIPLVLVVSYFDARKPYEVLALYLTVPWVLATFTGSRGAGRSASPAPAPAAARDPRRPPARRLHWLPAGVIGGLIVLAYQGFLVFGAMGILALVVLTWYADRAGRAAYLRHLAGVCVVALAVSSWYVVPYVHALLTREHKMISDMYTFDSMLDIVFPFASFTPLGILQLIGLVGLLWLRRSTWWAMPLLLLAGSAFLYRALMMVSYGLTGHTAFAHYAVEMVVVVLAASGVLVLGHVTPLVLDRLGSAPPRATLAVLLAVLAGWAAWSFAMRWMPGTSQSSPYADWAHQEPLPGGGYPMFAPMEGRVAWFPVGPIEQAVEEELGDEPRRVSLSVDDRLYAYLPWPGYLTTSRFGSGTFALFDQRLVELRRLAATSDPAAFAKASADTRFGPIDIFILRERDGAWHWQGLRFQESQFDPSLWTIRDDLPEDIVVAIRR